MFMPYLYVFIYRQLKIQSKSQKSSHYNDKVIVFLTFTLYSLYAGVMLNFFSGWPVGPAKIYFGWPAVSFTCPRYYYRFWGAYNNYHINQQKLKVSKF